jgi:hypothetical protein
VEDKVKEMVELDKYLATKYTVKTEGLTEKARQFYQQHVAKTVTCINRCFAGTSKKSVKSSLHMIFQFTRTLAHDRSGNYLAL